MLNNISQSPETFSFTGIRVLEHKCTTFPVNILLTAESLQIVSVHGFKNLTKSTQFSADQTDKKNQILDGVNFFKPN